MRAKTHFFYDPQYSDITGTRPYIVGLPRSTCNSVNAKAYIQFDISSLPDTVERVYLGVTHYPHPQTYCYSNCCADFYFYPVLEPWNEISTPSSPPLEGPSVYGPINISFPNNFGNKEYDITEIYRQWKSGLVPNNGLVIYSPDGTCNNAAVGFIVGSSDNPDEAMRPYLKIIDITSPEPTPSPSPTPEITPTPIPSPTGTPTAITLAYFRAKAGKGGHVTLTWETATEVDNAGFNLYRSKRRNGHYTQVNNAIIPAQSDAVSGASYRYIDTPGKGTFYYKLGDVDYYGKITMHGPEKVRVGLDNTATKRRKRK
ncbi:MAG: hypothetical protein AYP45_07870 [Candidatus Brocadia carolinensis]|uniref:TGF-beta propeptide domain-containing protein n=1 Tax=Candidatus Brocadia carolinensis TaxID=1004156 RepID=A0A1V4AU46_9BACT|nr:MAG: hypothetical protein AYP45_07870 [Candidatus Brocadia caroliniensis]